MVATVKAIAAYLDGVGPFPVSVTASPEGVAVAGEAATKAKTPPAAAAAEGEPSVPRAGT